VSCPLRGRSALLRRERVAVDVVAAPAGERRDEVGADPLRNEADLEVGRRILRPGAAVAADRHPRHALDAAGDDEVLPAARDLLRGEVHGLEARRAEAVDLHARDLDVPAGLERRRLRDHRALLADRRDDAHDDVVERRGVEAVALLQLDEEAGEQVDRLDLVQAAVLLALAARRADGVEDHGVRHGSLPLARRPARGASAIDKRLSGWAHWPTTKQVLG
jgi:hypothetical protein